MMKVATIIGTRPEFIRLSRIIPVLDSMCEQIIIHTGQNFDYKLNEIFFKELDIRKPDAFLEASGTFAEQAAAIFLNLEQCLNFHKPDRFLVLGDTNSSLGAVIAKRMGIPVYHMEAGNRCYDDRVPEEVNRRIIDHSSDVLMPYTERSRQNLVREGIRNHRIFVTGNPIKEVLDYYDPQIEKATTLAQLGVKPKEYFLVTLHREENVDNRQRLTSFLNALDNISRRYKYPVVISVHPRTRKRLTEFGYSINDNPGFIVSEPFGLFDFIKLEKNALCVLTDSGTVQEECSLFGVPNLTLRDSTERPETIEVGSNMITGADQELIESSVNTVLNSKIDWEAPVEYQTKNVSSTVAKIVLGYHHGN